MKRLVFLLSSLCLFLSPTSCAIAQEKPAAPSLTTQPANALLDLPTDIDRQVGVGPLRQADWFKNVWKTRRTAFAESSKQDLGSVVLFGDSITQGWPNLDSYFPNLKIANRGISGDTTRGMLIRLEQDVISVKPRGVVLLMGTNDLEEGAKPETIAKNVSSIIQQLKQHDSTLPIVLCMIFPSSESKARPTAQIQETNKLLMNSVRGDKQVTVLDTFALYANDAGDAKAEEFPDLLHLNKVGYDKWAASLRPLFATVDEKVSFEGKTTSSDGRYVAMNGRLVVTTPAEGRRIQQLWTAQEFPTDFVLKLEFRATPNADSGVFIRKPQLQCRDFPLAGPYKALKKYKPQDWNEIVVKVAGGTALCTCNGEVLEAEFKVPETGPIGLEGDRGQMEYRRIRIQELK